MKIILAVADNSGKNVVFVTDTLEILPLEKAISQVKTGELDELVVVNKKSGTYLRTKKSVPKSRELNQLSVNSDTLSLVIQGLSNAASTPQVNKYLQLYIGSLNPDKEFIIPIGSSRTYTVDVRNTLQENSSLIFEAAKKFNIDPYLLGAVLINEIARLAPFEKITDFLGAGGLGLNTSVGIAQVQIDTANNLIKLGLYNPDTSDSGLPFKRMNFINRRKFYKYLIEPKHNINFAAAYIRELIDQWEKFIDLTKRPEIIATLYHRSYKKPHSDPKPDDQGSQIVNEFYPLATKWLLK